MSAEPIPPEGGSPADPGDLWARMSDRLRSQVGRAAWASSLAVLEPVSLEHGRLRLGVPSGLYRRLIETRYLTHLRDAVTACGGTAVELVVLASPAAIQQPLPLPEVSPAAPAAPAAAAGSRFDRRQSFEAFVVGQSNRLAHAAAFAVAENEASAYNPLFIHGPAGNGKTHLLHAIGLYVQQHSPQLVIRYTLCEGFTNEFIDAIRGNGRAAFKQRYRRCHLLLVDDIQFLEGKDGTQEEFFHTFNEVVAGGGRVVLTSDRHPGDLSMLPDRLRSRFKSGLLSDLQAPEPATRLAILRKKAEAQGVAVPDEVLEFLAETVTSNVRELEGALIRLSATASLEGQSLTLDLAHRTMVSFLGSAAARPLTLEHIIEEAAALFGVPVADLIGPARTRTLVCARQAAMYVCRVRTNESLPVIARAFHKHDHTTVMHAVRKVEALMGRREPLYLQVVELMDRLGPDRRS